jgi:hypothetical protein
MIDAQFNTLQVHSLPNIFLSCDISSFHVALHIAFQSTLAPLRNAIAKADSNRHDKRKAEHGRAPFVVVADSHTPLDLVDTPEVDSH